MKVYIISLGTGLLVGVVYSLLNVRSPAPPLVALVGLFGILLGEQAAPLAKALLSGRNLAAAWRSSGSHQHLFGMLPGRNAPHVIIKARSRAASRESPP